MRSASRRACPERAGAQARASRMGTRETSESMPGGRSDPQKQVPRRRFAPVRNDRLLWAFPALKRRGYCRAVPPGLGPDFSMLTRHSCAGLSYAAAMRLGRRRASLGRTGEGACPHTVDLWRGGARATQNSNARSLDCGDRPGPRGRSSSLGMTNFSVSHPSKTAMGGAAWRGSDQSGFLHSPSHALRLGRNDNISSSLRDHLGRSRCQAWRYWS